MILPTKHLREDRALIAVGAELLRLLDEPKTVSRLWDELKTKRARPAASRAPARHQGTDGRETGSLPFDWFILALDLLYLLGTIELHRGRIQRVAR